MNQNKIISNLDKLFKNKNNKNNNPIINNNNNNKEKNNKIEKSVKEINQNNIYKIKSISIHANNANNNEIKSNLSNIKFDDEEITPKIKRQRVEQPDLIKINSKEENDFIDFIYTPLPLSLRNKINPEIVYEKLLLE